MEEKMNKNAKWYVNFVTIFSATAILGALLMVGGCGGGDESSPVATKSSQLNSTNSILNANGTVTTTASVTATTAGGATAMTIPIGTIITGSAVFPSLPVNINVSTPVNGVSGMPNPITAGFIISSTAGAEDITIGGMNTVTFSQPVTISILVDPAKFASGTVNMNKNNGNGWINIGTATLTGNVASFTTSNLCWFGVHNVYGSITGGTGSTGGSGTGSSF
jgi:hypothetical protein